MQVPVRLCLLATALSVILPSGAAEPPQIDVVSLVGLTFEHNLRVTAARFDVEASEFQFQRFERNLSQFRPLILETALLKSAESTVVLGARQSERDDEGQVSAGMSKEFFDGTSLEAKTGMRQTSDNRGHNSNPFVQFEARFPLFSSFTRLERITERSFEESEMLGSWLDFIETVSEAIADSQADYFDLQDLLALRSLVVAAQADFAALLEEPGVSGRERDVNLLRDQIQAYQSRMVEQDGEIAAAHISLIDGIGLDDLPLSSIKTMDLYAPEFYGSQYLEASSQELTAEAVASDVEMRVMEIARDNARLKRRLAERGEWDIVGRLVGGYDFESHGDNPSGRRGYRAGIALSVERNDSHLLSLSLRRASAEENKYEARIAYRRRQLGNEVARRLGQAASLRSVIREMEASRDLRRAVFAEKRQAYLAGNETLDNVIQARGQLFGTERDLLASLSDFFEVVVDLDIATGAHFARLEGILERFKRFGIADGSPRPPPSARKLAP